MRARDTSPEAYRVQVEILRSRSDADRVLLAFSASDELRELVRAGIRDRHPEYAEIDVARALRRLWLGDALFRVAYPREPLLDP